MNKTFCSLMAISALAACGGSGSATRDIGPGTGTAEFGALSETALEVFEEFEILEETEGYTSFDAVAAEDGGSSVYDGFASVGAGTFNPETETETLTFLAVGSFSVTADFGDAMDVTGTADEFFEVANPEIFESEDADIADTVNAGAIAGSFTFDLEIYDLEGLAVADGVVDGSVTALDGSVIALEEAEALGDFLGSNLDLLDVYAFQENEDSFIGFSAIGLR